MSFHRKNDIQLCRQEARSREKQRQGKYTGQLSGRNVVEERQADGGFQASRTYPAFQKGFRKSIVELVESARIP